MKSIFTLRRIALALLISTPLLGEATPSSPQSVADSTRCAADTIQPATTVAAPRKGLVGKILNYLGRANKPRPDKKFDFGFLPGPHYSSTTGLGLGMVATGLYSTDRSDTLLPKSNVSLFGDITTEAFVMLGLRGNHIFPKERFRIDYRLYGYTFPTYFYGIGFPNGRLDENKTDYRRMRLDAMVKPMVRVAPKMYLGPIYNFLFVQARNVEAAGEHLFEAQPHIIRAHTVGLSYLLDTRDFILNAQRGWFVQLDQTFTPRALGNDFCFSTTDLTVSTYRRVWRGGILAGEWHSRFNYGNPSWCNMSEAGSGTRLRGYYEGRYRDKNIAEAQIELRQHIRGRSGVAVWLAAGEVFPRLSAVTLDKLLPNGGVGYRWEFKPRVNVRLDLGLTRDGLGFMFNINEAF